jgi:glycosyltransferase involved in cell wall biosynthesis
MRVLHVIDSLNRGGAEVMLTTMAPIFRKWGVTCDVIVLLHTPSPLEQKLLDHGISLRFTGVSRLNSPLQVPVLARLLNGYDIVHVHLFPAQLWTALAASRRRANIPLVTTEHNTWNGRRRWWFRPLDSWMYLHYRRIACISDATAKDLIRWCPELIERVTVVPNGISLDAFEDATPATLTQVPHERTRLVFVGRCDLQKDHATLLRALVKVPEAHLLLVGDGPLRFQLEQLARSLGVSSRVSFLGWREDVAAILKASDIYVHSTHSDGFGIAACEAMAAGLPVVASDVPGLAQLVEGAGILVPAGDDKVLSRCLNTLIHSPTQRRKLSHAGLERARKFCIENTVQGYVHLYQSILGV